MPKHIFRLICLLLGVLVLALIAPRILTVDSFYKFGHYRANSVPEIAAQEPAYQTASYCLSCHVKRVAQWSANSHKSVTCEVCHGAAQGHPDNGKLPIPKDAAKLCTLCHEAMPGRPHSQPQIVLAQHNPYAASGQQCTACHNPHSPKIAAGLVKVTGNAAIGKQRAESCADCHGEDGTSPNNTWPNLAGQNAAYLARILAAYKSGDQEDVAMTPLAKELEDADIQNLAAYYASSSCKSPATRQVGWRCRNRQDPGEELRRLPWRDRHHGQSGLAKSRGAEARLPDERAQGLQVGPAQGSDDGGRFPRIE